MFATVSFSKKLNNALVVPATSILQEEDHSFLFVEVGNDRFVKTPVTGTLTGENSFIIQTGILPNDVVVVDGGIYLR